MNVNEAPQVTESLRKVDENSPVGTAVGAPIVASDLDGNPITLAITAGNSAGMFAVDNDGQITVVMDGLNFERVSSYELTVTATDNQLPPMRGSAVISVQVLDMNDAPKVLSAVYTIPEVCWAIVLLCETCHCCRECEWG